MAEHGRSHTRDLERLMRALPCMGFDVVDYRLEQSYRKDDGSLAGDIDALVRTDTRILIVEYKGEDRKRFALKREKSAFDQLDRASRYFVERLGLRPRSIYVNGPRFAMHERHPGSEGCMDLSRIADVLDPTDS